MSVKPQHDDLFISLEVSKPEKTKKPKKQKKDYSNIKDRAGYTPGQNRRFATADSTYRVKRPKAVKVIRGHVYDIYGAWGHASCKYIGQEGKHHLFQSVRGLWLISFTDSDIKYGLATSIVRE